MLAHRDLAMRHQRAIGLEPHFDLAVRRVIGLPAEREARVRLGGGRAVIAALGADQRPALQQLGDLRPAQKVAFGLGAIRVAAARARHCRSGGRARRVVARSLTAAARFLGGPRRARLGCRRVGGLGRFGQALRLVLVPLHRLARLLARRQKVGLDRRRHGGELQFDLRLGQLGRGLGQEDHLDFQPFGPLAAPLVGRGVRLFAIALGAVARVRRGGQVDFGGPAAAPGLRKRQRRLAQPGQEQRRQHMQCQRGRHRRAVAPSSAFEIVRSVSHIRQVRRRFRRLDRASV